MGSDWSLLVDSWRMALAADGYSATTQRTYANAVKSLQTWAAEHHPELGPAQLDREHVRAWLADLRATCSASTAHSWFPGLRHFCRFLVDEGEADQDATAGIRTPRPAEPVTPVLKEGELRRLLKACEGTDFYARRDLALVLLLVDTGLRRGEVAALTVDDVDVGGRVVHVAGKGSRRSGPRRRAVSFGRKTQLALDRYVRARRHHAQAGSTAFWLGKGSRGLHDSSIDAMLKARAAKAGIRPVHAHQLRHTWAYQFRVAGGQESDLMVLGGWTSHEMVARYGRASAAERAAEAGRRYSLADRL